MNKPMNHSYWGKSVDYREMLDQIAAIGPQLEANAPADEEAGELTPQTFALLKPLRFSHLLATEELGGAQMRPTEVLQLLEAVSYHSGSAGWVSMVHCCIGAMSAAFLPDSAVERLFAPGTDNRFSGQGAPLGMLKKVEGGYTLTGKWSYGSGFSHATWSHSACFVDDGTGKPAKDEAGNEGKSEPFNMRLPERLFTKPLARALIGKDVGDSVEVTTPGGQRSYEILAIRYE